MTIRPIAKAMPYLRTKIGLLILALIILGGLAGWLIGRSNHSANAKQATTNNQAVSSKAGAGKDVASMVSFTLPAGWSKGVCPASGKTVYIVPSGTSLNCNANPSAPIKAYVDPHAMLDCQQLAPDSSQNIKKHTCISLYIDGHKSLKSLTENGAGSAYNTDTTISDYYLNTGQAVAVFEYTYTSANNYQAGFDQLVTTAQVEN